jgi:predicted helicase
VARHATVVLGNPPFSGISQADGRWITELLRGVHGRTPPVANYYQAEGQPLGERKLWLQDDYVKFLRFAHWKIEQAGCGLIGLITNHGYLDNPTFRGVRYQLMQTFPQIEIIDLHGNRKKKEICPNGTKDANVFGIEQGTAVGLFRRRPGDQKPRLRHRELWGSTQGKLDALDGETDRLSNEPGVDSAQAISSTADVADLAPQPPFFFFVPRDESPAIEYRCSPRLVDIFPIHITAPVTARDHFVVGMERDELLERLAEFRDLSIPDDVIRRRFTNSRSRKYAPGDTRGWKLSEARRLLAADDHWQQRIHTCWYRPFDRRHVIWSGVMIDWPRDEVMGHLLAGPNLALIARRQMLPSQPCNYFWISDDLVLDGVIRSDNRGSESLFPLWVYTADGDGQIGRQANLDPHFVRALADAWDWTPVAAAAGDLMHSFGVEDVLHYIYALFFSEAYRTRYADRLRSDFPRVLLPRAAELFAQLCRYGRQLVQAHLLRVPAAGETREEDHADAGDWRIAPGYPRYAKGRVSINHQRVLAEVPQPVWNFHVGGHHVCRKWLKDRRGRVLRSEDRRIYHRMIAAIEQTLDLTQMIDQAIAAHGDWPHAFAVSPANFGI